MTVALILRAELLTCLIGRQSTLAYWEEKGWLKFPLKNYPIIIANFSLKVAQSFQLTPEFKQQALQWSNSFRQALILDNHDMINAFALHDVEYLIAAGSIDDITSETEQGFDKLKLFYNKHKGKHILGYLTYDLKNDIEALQSSHPDHILFPALYFFVPQHLLLIKTNGEIIGDPELISVITSYTPPPNNTTENTVSIKPRVSKKEYVSVVEKLKQHIIEGDIYEINYCVEFFLENAGVDPISLYIRLSEISPAPFGAFLKTGNTYLLCASPERFMKKKGSRIFSQPIKGTAARKGEHQADELSKQMLLSSEKERAENLMIVDLVRNDLARSSETGSVQVEELFGIYSFPQVHQMISTISSTARQYIHPVEMIKNAFPMGSMTGAPKIRAMELIEQYETTKRGLYSGAVGYFAPNGDFDFNVVIRSIQYNKETQYLNFEVGSAITYDAIAEEEYEECLLKAKALFALFRNQDFEAAKL